MRAQLHGRGSGESLFCVRNNQHSLSLSPVVVRTMLIRTRQHHLTCSHFLDPRLLESTFLSHQKEKPGDASIQLKGFLLNY
jgi:hypothetical protein